MKVSNNESKPLKKWNKDLMVDKKGATKGKKGSKVLKALSSSKRKSQPKGKKKSDKQVKKAMQLP